MRINKRCEGGATTMGKKRGNAVVVVVYDIMDVMECCDIYHIADFILGVRYIRRCSYLHRVRWNVAGSRNVDAGQSLRTENFFRSSHYSRTFLALFQVDPHPRSCMNSNEGMRRKLIYTLGSWSSRFAIWMWRTFYIIQPLTSDTVYTRFSFSTSRMMSSRIPFRPSRSFRETFRTLRSAVSNP